MKPEFVEFLQEPQLTTMESKLSKQLDADLIAAMRRLSPEQKLNAFLAHCQLMMELYQAGQRIRSESSKTKFKS